MPVMRTIGPATALALVCALAGCPSGENRCGPTSGIVARVLDGDTIDLESGERIRYLMIDTPEVSGNLECYGEEAKQLNTELVAGKEVSLQYDVECTDRFDRLLAYVSVGDREINSLTLYNGRFFWLIETTGFICNRKSE